MSAVGAGGVTTAGARSRCRAPGRYRPVSLVAVSGGVVVAGIRPAVSVSGRGYRPAEFRTPVDTGSLFRESEFRSLVSGILIPEFGFRKRNSRIGFPELDFANRVLRSRPRPLRVTPSP